jgi:DNA-binding IclR family transcriptional regulator
LDKKQGRATYTGLVPAVDQASRILLCLSRSPSPRMNLTDICRSVGIHKSKGYSILNTLLKFGLVQKDPAGKTYALGLGLISLSRRVLDSLNFSQVAGPFLETLARRTQSTALFSVVSDDNVFVVAKQEAEKNISVTIRVGYRFHLTHGAHGKAIAAFLGDEERERLLAEKKLFFHGPPARLDRRRLEAELARCRERGFAFDMGELNPGINVIASPVFDVDERVIGCIFIMGTFPESLIEEYGSAVAEGARQFSSMLGSEKNAAREMARVPS